MLLLEFRRFLQEGRLSQSELFLRRAEGGSRRLHLTFVGRGLGLAGAKGLLRGLRTVASARQLGLRGLDRFRPPIELRLPDLDRGLALLEARPDGCRLLLGRVEGLASFLQFLFDLGEFGLLAPDLRGARIDLLRQRLLFDRQGGRLDLPSKKGILPRLQRRGGGLHLRRFIVKMGFASFEFAAALVQGALAGLQGLRLLLQLLRAIVEVAA